MSRRERMPRREWVTDRDLACRGLADGFFDIRRATAWMESRPEVDGKQLGIMGTSLGGFMAALAAEMEPKLDRAAILLAGGGYVDAFWDDPRAAPYRAVFELAVVP